MRETEAEFQAAVIDLAMLEGWLVHHTRPARTKDGWRTPIQGHKGFPDLALAHPARGVLLVELKSDAGRVTPEQAKWAEVLGVSGRYRLWRPRDWPKVLAELRGLPEEHDGQRRADQ